MSRRFRGIGGVALAMTMVFVGVMPANAVEIDDSEAVSLTIHKLEHPGGELNPGTGAELASPAGTPLPGVTFTVTPILSDGEEINVANPAGWSEAAGLIERFNAGTLSADALDKGEPISVVTGTDGSVAVPDVGQGLYLVEEGEVTDAFSAGQLLGKAAPFLVMLPHLQADQTPLYDVHVYPKNTVVNGSKSVKEDHATGLGTESTTWRVEADVPLNTSALRQITITDPLPTGLTLVEGSIQIGVTDALGSPASGITSLSSFEDGSVEAVFGAEGIGEFGNVGGGKVWLEFATTTTDIGSGTIVNEARIIHHTPETTVTTDVDAEVYWGAVQIIKHTEGNPSEGLSGAEFQVFTSESNADTKQNPVSVLVDGAMTSTFTSGSDGKVAILGLNAKQLEGTDYWIVETQAPTGYAAASDPIKVTVTPSSEAEVITVEIPNSPVKLQLPGLGNTGMIAVYVIGAALLLAGVATFLLSRKTRAH